MIQPENSTDPQLAIQERYNQQRNLQRYPLTAGEYADGSEDKALSLKDFFNILRRRRAIAINTFILVVVIGIVLTLITTPRYSSSARILVEGKIQAVTISDTENPLSNLFIPRSGYDVATQVQILRSPLVLNEAYKATNIPPGAVSVEATVVPQTDLIDLTVTSTSKNHAEGFAKALPEVYLQKVRDERMAEIRAALAFARRRVDEQKQRVTQAETALATFEKNNGVIRTDTGEQIVAEMTAAGAALRQAEADLAAARSRLNALRNARSNLSRTLTTPVTSTNPEVAALKGRIAELQSQRAELLFLYKEGEDEVKKVDLQIRQLQQRLAKTPATVTTESRSPNPAVSTLDSQITDARVTLQAAEAAVVAARARTTQVEPELAKISPLERSSARLQRDLEIARQSLDALTQNTEDLMLREQAAQAKNNPVSVISAASPARQISPRVARNIATAIFLGLLLACGMAMLQHSLDDHVNDEDEARSLLDIPVLGVLPLVVDDTAKGGEPALTGGNVNGRPTLVLSRDEPRLMESFRMLRSNVYFSLVNSPSRTILVTSTISGEGKTTTSANLATVMALDGRRVILVDADMRRPGLDSFFNVPRQPGLSNVLAGQESWRDVLHETSVPGLRLLTCGVLPPNPAELLNSPALDNLISELQDEADMVIFDTPPCPATADTQVLSAKVDGVVYVMHLGKVRKAGLQHAFELLQQANANILGVVFNKFESSAGQGYGYYYGYHHYGDQYGSPATENGSVKGNAPGANEPSHADGVPVAQSARTPFDRE